LGAAWTVANAERSPSAGGTPLDVLVILMVSSLVLYVVSINRSYPSRRALPFSASVAALACCSAAAAFSAGLGLPVSAAFFAIVSTFLLLVVVWGALDAQGAETLRGAYVRAISPG
jgi:hypothetical protein